MIRELAERGLASVQGLSTAVSAPASCAARPATRSGCARSPLQRPPARRGERRRRDWLSEAEAKALLAAAGDPGAGPARIAADADGRVVAAARDRLPGRAQALLPGDPAQERRRRDRARASQIASGAARRGRAAARAARRRREPSCSSSGWHRRGSSCSSPRAPTRSSRRSSSASAASGPRRSTTSRSIPLPASPARVERALALAARRVAADRRPRQRRRSTSRAVADGGRRGSARSCSTRGSTARAQPADRRPDGCVAVDALARR